MSVPSPAPRRHLQATGADARSQGETPWPRRSTLPHAVQDGPRDPARRRALGLAGLAGLAATATALPGGAAAQAGPAPKQLAGKAAIVTGARNNLGRAYAVMLARHGASVVVHHHLPASLEEARETARLVEAAGGKATLVHGDLGQVEVVRRVYDAAFSTFGRLDVVINNAGFIRKKPLAEVTDEEFERCLAVNTRGLFFSLREAARRIADGGRIINIGTSLLTGITPGYGAYAGTKAPVEELTRALAKEVGARGITVNVVAPGPVDTPFYHREETAQSAAYGAGLSVAKRLGAIGDIVPLVEWLALPASQWVTGQTLWINGGYATR